MKTTIDIADPLFKQAQQLAAKEGTTFRSIVEEGLRTVISHRKNTPAQSFKLRDGSVNGKGLRPEFQDAPWEVMRDLTYGLPPIDRR